MVELERGQFMTIHREREFLDVIARKLEWVITVRAICQNTGLGAL